MAIELLREFLFDLGFLGSFSGRWSQRNSFLLN